MTQRVNSLNDMVETLTLVATMIVGLNLWRYWGSQVSFRLFLQLPLVIAELLTTGKLPLVNYLFDKKNTSARNYNFWIKSHWVYQYITQRGGKWRGSNKWITKVDREIVFLFFFFFFFFATQFFFLHISWSSDSIILTTK